MRPTNFTLRPSLLALGLAAGCAATDAHAATFALSGTFAQDDDLYLASLLVSEAGAVTVTSFGYAAGGFDSMLFLYSASGTLIAQSDDGIGAATDPLTGLASDAGFSINLAPGVYTLALTQYDNFALGNFSAGFSNTGAGNFTPALSGGCDATRFCDWSGAARTGHWELTISGVSAVPELGTWQLMALGIAAAAVFKRRRPMESSAGR